MGYDSRLDHRRSIRLSQWDYAETGAYFVTVCSHLRACIFTDEALASVLQQVWESVCGPAQSPGEFVIMPNHIHGIVWIDGQNPARKTRRGAATVWPSSEDFSLPTGVPLTNVSVAAPLQAVRRFGDGLEPGTLSTIVRTFKAASARRINNLRQTPGSPVWQGNYHERVIRNERELDAAREYILDNPRKWAEDKHNPAHVGAQQPRTSVHDARPVMPGGRSTARRLLRPQRSDHP